MKKITQSVIDGINSAINTAAPFAAGDPLPDTEQYTSLLESFPQIDDYATMAYEMAWSCSTRIMRWTITATEFLLYNIDVACGG